MKYVLMSYNRIKCAITIYYRFPALLTSPLYHVATTSFIPVGNRGSLVSLPEDSKKCRKKLGEDTALKQFQIILEKNMHMNFKVLKCICPTVLFSN